MFSGNVHQRSSSGPPALDETLTEAVHDWMGSAADRVEIATKAYTAG